MHPHRLLAGVGSTLVLAAALALLHGCQDSPEPTAPALAVTIVKKTLTVSGGGSGSGVVTSSPAGINCTITAGAAAATGCVAQFTKGVVVVLTATPNPGHSFLTWQLYCAGSGTCRAPMTSNRSVRARFLKGPFTVKITSGTPGVGKGTVKSQAGLTPAINCVITNGTPAATGCSAKYPAYTALVLTATPAAGFTSASLGGLCAGAASCAYTVVQTQTIPAGFGTGGSSTAAVQGEWAAAFPTPVVAIHMHLLPTGRVLLWGDKGETQVWDPASPGAFTQVLKTFQYFCSGHTVLPDGRILVAGGHITADHGLAAAAVFDPSSGTWTNTNSMARGRWYPTTTALPDGEVLALAGTDEDGVVVPTPEIWNGSGWRPLTTAALELPYYPRLFVAPNGKLFYAGDALTTRYLDIGGTGAWTTVADRNVADREAGSAVMYAPGKILYAGGGDPPTASAEVIDLNQAAPAWRTVPGMAFARRQMNATLLADGKVLVTNGSSGPGFNNLADAVHYAELWNPATESWTTMAREATPRVYHSTALLLPDGRVLSSGSGEGDGVTFAQSELSAEVFSPPYLFNPDGSLAARPTISSAPATLAYGQTVSVGSPDAGSVTRGTLIRLSSVTHAFNASQVIYPLVFGATGPTTLQAAGPANANLAPPGPYLLFLVNGKGVPSVAKIVTVGR
jgi:hypothetical protein